MYLFMYIYVGPASVHRGTGVAAYTIHFLGRQQQEAFPAMFWKLHSCGINQLQCKIIITERFIILKTPIGN